MGKSIQIETLDLKDLGTNLVAVKFFLALEILTCLSCFLCCCFLLSAEFLSLFVDFYCFNFRMASHHRGKEAAAGPSRSKRSLVQPAQEGPFFEGEVAESEDEAAEAGSGYYEQFSSSGDGKSHRGSFTVENLADIQRSV